MASRSSSSAECSARGSALHVGFFIFPYVFPPPAASEQLSAAEHSKLVASGTFIHANPSDPVHYGKGHVSVYERTVFLESDFEVGPGPAFHVYLVPKASIRSTSDVKDLMFVDLGGLARLQGQPALSDPGRRRPEELSKRDHLVRALRRSHLPSRPDDGRGCEVRVYLAETPKCERLTDALDESGP